MKYKLGHTYIDTGGSSRPNDQFLRWINIPGSGMGNSEGIRSLNYTEKDSNHLPAYVILVSHEVKRAGNPWQDFVDFNSATINYWGDAKYSVLKSYNEFKGNKRLMQIWESILEGRLLEIPPILHFSKPNPGVVVFNGLCAIEELQITWFEHSGKPVKNYRLELSILDADEVDVDWLHYRAKNYGGNDINLLAPSVWKDYIKGNTRKLDIWKKEILDKGEQLPKEGSNDEKLLEQLQLLTPIQFEAVVVEIFKHLPHVSHKITRTRPTADGGFDFFGQFVIPFPIGYEIDFLGEVKQFNRDSPVQPKHVSRLVARLSRGQFGVFVTTSYYTRQTQKEVLEDNYPIKLFNGLHVVTFLKELRLIQDNKIKREWLDAVVTKMRGS